MAYVLASDIEDMDPETGAIRLLGKRGESLPTSLKDSRDDYIRDGILVDESKLPGASVSMTWTEMEHSLKDVDLSDDQMEAVKKAFDDRHVEFSEGATDDHRRQVAHDVSSSLAQVHKDRTAASPAIHRATAVPKASTTSAAKKD